MDEDEVYPFLSVGGAQLQQVGERMGSYSEKKCKSEKEQGVSISELHPGFPFTGEVRILEA